MRSLKEQMQLDAVGVFMNPEEFAEVMNINGVPVLALWDDTLQPLGTNSQTDPTGFGVTLQTAVLLVLAEDFACPLPNEEVVVEGERYTVAKAVPQSGILRLELERHAA